MNTILPELIPFSIALLVTTAMVSIWSIIISRSHRENLSFFFWITFSITFVLGILWKLMAEHNIEQSLLSFFSLVSPYYLFFTLLSIGIIIELGKNTIVRLFGKNFFETLDDVVDLSFATALGFTAAESIIHFYTLFQLADTYDTPMIMVKEVISQSFFILPIHLFCSGIFGYYYGLALFATPKERTFWKKLYPIVQFIKGTFISTLTYGIFFYILRQHYTIYDISSFFGFQNLPLNESIFPFISFLFSSVTALYLFEKMGNANFITETKEEKEKRIEKEEKERLQQKS